jgi:hypothetical protein
LVAAGVGYGAKKLRKKNWVVGFKW